MLNTNIPTELNKSVIIMNPGVINKSMRITLFKEILTMRNAFDCFAFMEWAEPWTARLNRRYPLADARLLTGDEIDELGTCFGQV